MAVAAVLARPSLEDRLLRTTELLERRGYALPPDRLASVCLGGPLPPEAVPGVVAASRRLAFAEGLVVTTGSSARPDSIRRRQASHALAGALFLGEARHFAERLARLCPFVLSVSVAGSLASGGFAPADDIDLNLVVEDGRRHLAYVALNLLALLSARRYRGKPVDTHTSRPLAPRVMTANLILERSQCFPLARQDEDMAYELLVAKPLLGGALLREVVSANPRLLEHFPQLEGRIGATADVVSRLPDWLFPAWLDRPAHGVGATAWRFMQWTRRHRPDALARVAYVRACMRPYTLFDA